MKTKNKSLILFVSIVSILLVQTMSFSPYVMAIDDKPEISADLLAVSTGDFVDNTPNDGSGMLKTISGGSDLISFDNLGVKSYSEDKKTVLFEAEAIFGFEMTANTEATWQDIFPQAIVKPMKHTYFTYSEWQYHDWDIFQVFDPYITLGPVYYDFFYSTIVGMEDVAHKRHDYNGDIPITVTIDAGLRYGGDIVIGEETFSVPKIMPDISKVIVTNYRSGEVGEYEDVFVESDIDSDKTLEIIVMSDTISIDTKEVLDFINNENMGHITYGEYQTIPIQQQAISGDPVNSEYPEIGVSNALTFNYQSHLQPGVDRVHQDNGINFGALAYDRTNELVLDTVIMPDRQWDRNIAVHVDNVYTYTNFIVKVYFVMTAEFDAALSISVLNDPNFELSDMVWDATVNVNEGKILILPPPPKIDWLLIIIIILVVGVGSYVAWNIYKRQSERTFMLKLAGRR